MARSMARELGSRNTANVVAPGPVETEMLMLSPKTSGQQLLQVPSIERPTSGDSETIAFGVDGRIHNRGSNSN